MPFLEGQLELLEKDLTEFADVVKKMEKSLKGKRLKFSVKPGVVWFRGDGEHAQEPSKRLEMRIQTMLSFLTCHFTRKSKRVIGEIHSHTVQTAEVVQRIDGKITIMQDVLETRLVGGFNEMKEQITKEISMQTPFQPEFSPTKATFENITSTVSLRIHSWYTYKLPVSSRARTNRDQNNNYRSKSDFQGETMHGVVVEFIPARWLSDRALSVSVINCTRRYGSTINLTRSPRIFSILPREHEAFRFAKEGNINGLQRLFSEGRATPNDRDAKSGKSLLHFAAELYASQVDWARTQSFLIKQGADVSAADFSGCTPAHSTLYWLPWDWSSATAIVHSLVIPPGLTWQSKTTVGRTALVHSTFQFLSFYFHYDCRYSSLGELVRYLKEYIEYIPDDLAVSGVVLFLAYFEGSIEGSDLENLVRSCFQSPRHQRERADTHTFHDLLWQELTYTVKKQDQIGTGYMFQHICMMFGYVFRRFESNTQRSWRVDTLVELIDVIVESGTSSGRFIHSALGGSMEAIINLASFFGAEFGKFNTLIVEKLFHIY